MPSELPSDVISVVSTHSDPRTLRQLRLANRVFHDAATPHTFRNIHLSLEVGQCGYPERMKERIQNFIAYLPSFASFVQHLKIEICEDDIRHDVPADFVPKLWDTLSLLHSLKSLSISWGLENWKFAGETAGDMDVAAHISGIIMTATGGRLEKLEVIPAFKGLIIPTPLLGVQGLFELKVRYKRDDETNRTCRLAGGFRVGHTFAHLKADPSDVDVHLMGPPLSCTCNPGPMNAVAGIIRANPTLRNIHLTSSCIGRGYPIQDVFLPALSNLHSITLYGVNPWGVQSLLPASSLRNLRHVEILSDYNHAPMYLLWRSMEAAQTRLETLTVAQVSLSLVHFLASFSGLKHLKIHSIRDYAATLSPQVTSAFFELALPPHVSTLETLSISHLVTDDRVNDWNFQPTSWIPLLPQMTSLKSLCVCAYPRNLRFGLGDFKPNDRFYDRIMTNAIASSYQSVIDTIQLAPNLNKLEIHWPESPPAAGYGYSQYEWERECRYLLSEVGKLLTCASVTANDVPKPKELKLFSGLTYETRWNERVRWRFVPDVNSIVPAYAPMRSTPVFIW